MLVCAAFIIPVGVASAIYLEEYREPREVVPAVHRGQHPEPRGRTPSIVYGVLGLAFLVRDPFDLGNVFAGA